MTHPDIEAVAREISKAIGELPDAPYRRKHLHQSKPNWVIRTPAARAAIACLIERWLENGGGEVRVPTEWLEAKARELRIELPSSHNPAA